MITAANKVCDRNRQSPVGHAGVDDPSATAQSGFGGGSASISSVAC